MKSDPFKNNNNYEVALSGDAYLKRDGELDFDEQAYIDEVLQILTELHGGFNGQDEMLVKHMASYERSYRMADYRLMHDAMHMKKSGAHGLVCSGWVDLRERCSNKIMQIRKDLGMDVSSRKPTAKAKNVDIGIFNSNFKEKTPIYS